VNCRPRVSVITPSYNGADYIENAIKSVLAQTMSAWEYIIVDDGSVDETRLVVSASAGGDSRIRYIYQSNGGVASARASGAVNASSTSDYLLFLDHDDCLEPNMLLKLVTYLDNHREAGLAYCRYMVIDNNGLPTGHPVAEQFRRYIPSKFWVESLSPQCPVTPFISVFSLISSTIIPSVAVIRRSIFNMTPGWDIAFGQPVEDTDLFLHIARYSELHYIDEPLVRYRVHQRQSTQDLARHRRQRARLYQKWVDAPWLADAERSMIRRAWRFREGKLLTHFWLSCATAHFRAGHSAEAAKCMFRVARQFWHFAANHQPGSYYS
jgi:glycosyltransferase involved in cell wall biosynthesis